MLTPDTLTALISKLEAATGPSRELDTDIHILLHRCDPTCTYNAKEDCLEWLEHHPEVPGGASELLAEPLLHYTSSLDAAMTLVPEGWFVEDGGECRDSIIRKGDRHDPIGKWWLYLQHIDGGRQQRGFGITWPIALCIAALKARSAE